MIKQLVLGGTAFAVLAAAGMPAGSAVRQTAPANAAAGKPQLGAWGVDLAGMDRSVNPGDSFYGYVNGNWDKSTEIPADKAQWGGFGMLADLSDQRTRAIIEDAAKANAPAGSVQRKVGDFYASFMNEAAIEARGAAPLQPFLQSIAAIRSTDDLARAFGKLGQFGIESPIGAGVQQDLKNNTQYAVYLGQGGLGLPDRDYYLDDSNPKFVETRAKYKAHIANMFRLAGIADGEARAQRILDLETKIARSHWTRVQQRQLDKLYNPMGKADLAAKMPGFDWAGFLASAGVGGEQRMIVAQPSALEDAARLIQSEPLDTWKDYLSFHVIDSAAPMLSKAFVDEHFDFNGKVLAGTPQLKDRWKRGVDLVGGGMGEAVGQLYVARYFPPAAKAKADELVHNLIRAMDVRLANLAWMTPETKAKARAKLASFTPKIGYPDKWRDYSALEIRADDALGNALRADRFEYLR